MKQIACGWCSRYHEWPTVVGLSLLILGTLPVGILFWFIHLKEEADGQS